jgi:orotate phosphoribosyltransferase-like protein
MISQTELTTPQRHSTAVFCRAYALRQSGLSLSEIATACKVPRGSVAYLISQGHEIHLAAMRSQL